ncbi:hypothetical protein RISK_006347 [Rhodopirellula islandica]|uniref:Uncharacterized protein n=1 Tax=Rhodopirellula islandica TaxID=595434 RepID=A0A0J1B569_RHOIS|nr:hypothetical protein RISK_006347 [Rhodopirellula islandica]
MKFTIYNFTFSIHPPSHPSPPVAASRLVERDCDTQDLGLKTRG